MSNEVLAPKTDNPFDFQVEKYSDEVFDDEVKSSGFMPRVQFVTANTDKGKSGEFPLNHFAIVQGDDYTDLGDQIDVLILTWRLKAIDFSGDQVINSYDKDDDTYKQIKERSTVRDSRCMYGPEFLIWLPKYTTFATFFCGSKSAHFEAKLFKVRIGLGATFFPRKIKSAKHTWYIASVKPCNSPFDRPDLEKAKAVADKFNNPPKQVIELAPEKVEGERER